MKRLASLKSPHADSTPSMTPRQQSLPMTSRNKRNGISKNHPYALSGRADTDTNAYASTSTPLSSQRSRHSSISQSKQSVSYDISAQPKSRAPTLGTTAETAISDVATSGAGTGTTGARTDGDRNSTFSSPAPSIRSMTTLTTIQSQAPPANNANAAQAPLSVPGTASSHLSPSPAPAIPAHLVPHGHPTTYQSATANNVLTDDASILTLASSSKRRRRNSVDTNASMRALAPQSMFGGSRESLPLSVLSGTVIHPGQADNASLRDASGSIHQNSKLNAERASLISASGIAAPALASERNSYIGSRHGDGASVRSGLLGRHHGRNDSVTGSIGGQDLREREMVTAPTSPLIEGEAVNYTTGHMAPERVKPARRSSDWADQRLNGASQEIER